MSEAKEISRADYLNSVGAKLFGEGEVEPARLHFLAALSLENDHPQALQNLGAALRQMKHFAAAEVVAKRSVVASGGNPHCRSNLGVSQLNLGKYDAALSTLRQVTVDLPDNAPTWHNFGLVHYMMGHYKEALAAFDKALACQKSRNPSLESDRALTLLSLGLIQEGLEAYEVRWEILAKNHIWSLNIPEWHGEDLKGTRVLLHHEQGFGDSIMLVRLAQTIAAKGAHITLAVPEELRALFKLSYPFFTVVALGDESLQGEVSFDYHIPMLSALRWLGVKRVGQVEISPYLTAPKTIPMTLPRNAFRVGLVWASGDHGPSLAERRRLVPLNSFLPLLEHKEIALISLQKGDAQNDIVRNGLEGLVFDCAPWLSDFAVTAGVINQLDLVISVDSAVAHLAGALGKPCVMLSPYTRCWRWWGEASGWPWYQNMKIAPQSKDMTWGEATRFAVKAAMRYSKVAERVEF